MALGFLKKLAAKLIGSKKPSAKPESGVRQQASNKRNKNAHRKDKRKQHSSGKAAGESFQRERNRRGNQPKEQMHQRRTDGPENVVVATSARPSAKPSSRRRDRNRDRGPKSSPRPVNTAPSQMRPGGVLTPEMIEQRKAEHAKWDASTFAVEAVEGKKRFHDFDLPGELLHAIADLGFQYCTPIQSLSLDAALAGKNVAGRAQTGTGKTAAFLVALLTRYLRTPDKRPVKGGAPRSLILAPTRELVIQIAKDACALGKYTGLRCLAVYGGMDYDRQRDEVTAEPVDLLVATPGRLLDFVRSHVVNLGQVDTLIVDEADRMLDMGFIPDIRAIMNRLPPKEQRATMLYSATLNEDIMRLASQWMEEPVRCECEGDTVNTKAIKQIVYVVTSDQKFKILFNHIQTYPDSRTLIFCNRRNTTEFVAKSLRIRGISCEMLNGDVSQNHRLRVLEDFRSGKTRIVVATDVAGRGLHVDDIGFVINFDFPYEAEDYVHRIGRTGRAGQSGTAISFADEDESFTIPDIESYIGEELKCTMLDPEDPLLAELPDSHGRKPRRQREPEKEQVEAPESGDAAAPAEQPAAETPVVAEDAQPEAASSGSVAPSADSAAEPADEPVADNAEPSAAEADGAKSPDASAEAPVEAVADEKPEAPARPAQPFIRERLDGGISDDEVRPKEPLKPLCKPVFDKPWMTHEESANPHSAKPRPRKMGSGKMLEEWTPGKK